MSHSTVAALLASLSLLAACEGPFLLASGGPLEGATAEAPQSWAFSDEVSTVQLETLSSAPYSVNIWAVGVGEHLYVHSGTNRAQWIENMDADPNVRMQIGESIYALRAERVTEQAEFDRFSAAYENKYGNAPRNGSVTEAHLYRLSAR